MKKLIRISLSVLIAILIVAAFFGFNNTKVSRIECNSQFGPCSDALEAKLENSANAGFSQAKREIEQILSSEPLVRDYAVYFRLPSKLEVYLVEKEAIYALSVEEFGVYALVDKSGEVLFFDEITSLPVLFVDTPPPDVGGMVDSEILFAIGLLARVNLLTKIDKAYVQDGSLFVELNNDYSVIFPLSGDTDVLLGSLSLILSRLNNTAAEPTIEKISTIDLRFANPVLK